MLLGALEHYHVTKGTTVMLPCNQGQYSHPNIQLGALWSHYHVNGGNTASLARN